MAKIIYQIKLQGFEKVTWHGRDVFSRHAQISNYLERTLGADYASLLATPVISKYAAQGRSKAIWTSEVLSQNAKSIIKFPPEERQRYFDIFTKKKKVVLNYCEKLIASGNKEDVNWGELVKSAFQIPDDSFIIADNKDVCIVAWGFKYVNQEQAIYDFSQSIRIPEDDQTDIEPTPEIRKSIHRTPEVETPIDDKPEENTPEVEQPNKEDSEDETPETEDAIRIEPPEDEISKTPEPQKTEEPVAEDESIRYLPEKPNVIIPIDPEKLIISDDETTTIVEDRLNIALLGENKNLEVFAEKFKGIYPREEYRIIYYNDKTYRLQIEVPTTEREKLKTALKKELSEFRMLIWDEKIFRTNEQKKNWFYEAVQAPSVWEMATTSEEVVIAVIDHSFDLNSNFSAEIYRPLNIIEGNNNLYPINNNSHGNHVAGIAVGLSEEEKEVHGIAPKCKLMPIQVADYNGNISTTAIIDALLYAIENKADVVNISLGTSFTEEVLRSSMSEQKRLAQTTHKDEEEFWKEIYNEAYRQNISVVIASGNDDALLELDPMNRSQKTIVVSAVDKREQRASFSNFGDNSTLSAPGVGIFSSLVGNRQGYKDGTSMAAPIVTGCVAVLKSIEPNLEHDEIVELLQTTGKKVSDKNKNIGNLVQLDNAVRKLKNLPPIKVKEPRKFRWKWFLLLGLILLLVAILLGYCKSTKTYLPDRPNIIVPIDTTKIVSDPDSIRKIVSNRCNVALIGENTDIVEFAKQFKKAYPSDDYSIIYYDTMTYSLQIELPPEDLQQFKEELPDKLTDFELLIWDESLYRSDYIPQDPGFSKPRDYWYHQNVKALSAWDISRGDSTIIIAVIDDGFDLTHPEFAGKIYKPWNTVTHSPNVNTGRHLVHGTHVAGIATGLANNSKGVAGIAPNCKLMPIQIADSYGYMGNTPIKQGILYAIHNGANVINMSLGQMFDPRIKFMPQELQEMIIETEFKDEEKIWKRIFEIAYKKNIVVVLAAGNQDIVIGLDPMQRYEKCIKVSATTTWNARAEFSNYGKRSTISAPGVDIYSSLPNNNFGFFEGTSMAAPIVTGGIALIKSVNPTLSYDEIIDLIQSTGIPVNHISKYVGNILQLDVALDIANRNREIQPIVSCPEKQKKIDSLLREIEKIRSECPDTTILTDDTLKIPDTPTEDFTFAEGRWKSTGYLYSTNTGEKITLYFEFFANGTGKLTLVEENGTRCSANLKLKMDGKNLIIDQIEQADCNRGGDSYNEYIFECKPDKAGLADCYAQNKTNKKNFLNFKLIKIR